MRCRSVHLARLVGRVQESFVGLCPAKVLCFCCVRQSEAPTPRLWAGYMFGSVLKRDSNAEFNKPAGGVSISVSRHSAESPELLIGSEIVLPIIRCHSKLACAGGETSPCSPGYAGTRCACDHAPPGLTTHTHPVQIRPAWVVCRHICPYQFKPSGFGHRCGMCDVGYYSLSARCEECGDANLVQFLSKAIPIFGAIGVTAFLFYGGASHFVGSLPSVIPKSVLNCCPNCCSPQRHDRQTSVLRMRCS
jgi:hypothetical protein